MGLLTYLILLHFHLQHQTVEGHWLRISEKESSCTEELIFKKNGAFSILSECFEENEIHEVATGKYLTDGDVIYFSALRFSSRVSDFYTREYSRMEWKLSGDTLKITAFRYESEERSFIRY